MTQTSTATMTRTAKATKKVTVMAIAGNIIALLILLCISMDVIYTSNKVMATAFELSGIRGETRLYNEDTIKSDFETEEQIARDIRRNEIYNSEDWLIRTVFSSNGFIKTIVVTTTACMYLVIPGAWFILIMRNVNWTKRYLRSKKRIRR